MENNKSNTKKNEKNIEKAASIESEPDKCAGKCGKAPSKKWDGYCTPECAQLHALIAHQKWQRKREEEDILNGITKPKNWRDYFFTKK